MKFLTATVELVADDSKLKAQLAKLMQKIKKSTEALEKSYYRQRISISKVNDILKGSRTLTGQIHGSTVTVRKELGKWATKALYFRMQMRHNLKLAKKFRGVFKNLSEVVVWPLKQIPKLVSSSLKTTKTLLGQIKKLISPEIFSRWKVDRAALTRIKLVNKEQLHGIKLINIERERAIKLEIAAGDIYRLKGALDKDYWESRKNHIQREVGGIKTIKTVYDQAGISAEEFADALVGVNEQVRSFEKGQAAATHEADQLSASVRDASRSMDQLTHSMSVYPRLTDKYMRDAADDIFGGPKMRDASQVLLEVYSATFGKIYDAAKWAFGGILNIVTSVFRKIVGVSKWTKVGVVAVFAGMYGYIIKAAMDYESAQAKIVGTVGTTADTIKQMYDAIKYVAAGIGKPFIKDFKAISLAITGWLIENKERFSVWAEKISGFLKKVQYGFIDWIKFLATDFKGGVFVALKVVEQLFRGFADSLVILMDFAGRRAGQALVDGFRGLVTRLLPSLAAEAQKSLEWLGQKIRKAGQPTGRFLFGKATGQVDPDSFKLGGRAPSEAESVTAAISRVYRERAEKIKKLLKDMPTWGSTEADSIKIAEEATKKYDEFNLTLKENDVEYTMDRLEAYRKMYDDIDKWNQKRYNNAMTLLKRERADYLRAGVDRVTAYEWMSYQIRELDRERAIDSENFFAGFNAAIDQSEIDMIKWGEIGQTVAQTMESAFATAYTSMTIEGANWSDAMKGFALDVLRAFQRQLAAQTAAKFMAGIVGPALSGIGGALFGSSPTQMDVGMTGGMGSIPGLQHGGEVLSTGLAVVHKGETFSGVEGGGPKVTVNVINQGKNLEVESVDEFQNMEEHVVTIVVNDIVGGGPLAQLTGAK